MGQGNSLRSYGTEPKHHSFEPSKAVACPHNISDFQINDTDAVADTQHLYQPQELQSKMISLTVNSNTLLHKMHIPIKLATE